MWCSSFVAKVVAHHPGRWSQAARTTCAQTFAIAGSYDRVTPQVANGLPRSLLRAASNRDVSVAADSSASPVHYVVSLVKLPWDGGYRITKGSQVTISNRTLTGVSIDQSSVWHNRSAPVACVATAAVSLQPTHTKSTW